MVPIHEADAVMFLDRLLPNLAELDWGVVWHFDKVSLDSRERMLGFSGTIGFTEEVDGEEFRDIHRQAAWDVAASSGAAWIVPHDADETWEPKTNEILQNKELLSVRNLYWAWWYNVWGFDSNGVPLIRTLPKVFVGYRPRFYPTHKYQYAYRRGTALPYCVSRNKPTKVASGLRILHYGFSTPELRQRHLLRWKGIINSGFWDMTVNPDLPITLRPFDPDKTHEEWIK